MRRRASHPQAQVEVATPAVVRSPRPPESAPAFHRPIAIRALALSLALAIGIAWISASLVDRAGQQVYQAEIQIQILTGDVVAYLPQWSGRVLFPLGQVLLSSLTGLSNVAAFLALRFVTLVAMCLTVWMVAGKPRHLNTGNPGFTDSVNHADRTTLTIAVLLVLSFNHAWQTPTDALDVIAFALGTYFALSGRFEPMMILTLVASANRESSLFLSLIWIGAQWHQQPLRTLVRQGAVLGIGAALVVALLRYGTAGWAGLVPPDMAGLGSSAINIPSPMTLPLGLAMLLLCRSQGVPSRGIALACLGMVLLSSAGGTAHELRIYLPAVTVWTLAGVSSRHARLSSRLASRLRRLRAHMGCVEHARVREE